MDVFIAMRETAMNIGDMALDWISREKSFIRKMQPSF